MVIGFKPQFVEAILNGTKKHTIREDSKERWCRGMLMHMATGTRTRNYKCFMELKVVSVQRVFMSYSHILQISVDGKELFGAYERERFAIADGFENLKAFEKYWIPVMAKNRQEFSGRLIHWTDLRY